MRTLLLLGLVGCAATRGSTAELPAVQQALVDAIAVGDKAVWDKHMATEFIFVEDGRVLDRKALLAELEPLPPGISGRIELVEPKIVELGDVAVLSVRQMEHETLFDQKIVQPYHATVTFVWRDGRWRMVAQHVNRLEGEAAAVPVKQPLADYAGEYAVSPEMKLQVVVEDGRLYAVRGTRPRDELLPAGVGVFFVRGRVGIRIFVRDEQGKVVKILDRRNGVDVVWTKRS